MTAIPATFAAHAHVHERTRPSRPAVVASLGSLAAFTGFVVWADPFQRTIFPTCPFHSVTGGWCPGCGATRASYRLLTGDVVGALHLNALWVLFAPLVTYCLLAWGVHAFAGRQVLPRPRMTQRWSIVVLGLGAAFWVVRNLPIHALHVLNPPS